MVEVCRLVVFIKDEKGIKDRTAFFFTDFFINENTIQSLEKDLTRGIERNIW